MIRLLIIDDHPIVLEGTKTLFQGIEDILVETTSDILNISQIIKEQRYDIYLIDINIPPKNGVILSEEILILQPSALIIFYTGDNIEDYLPLLLERKIHGLLSKTSTKETIIRTIRSVYAKEILLPWSVFEQIPNCYLLRNKSKEIRLSERERRILQLISKGYTNVAISLELNLTQRTIERNLSTLYDVLNVSSRTEAVVVAKERNLI